VPTESVDFLSEKEVRRFGYGDGEFIANEEEGKYALGFEKISGEHFEYFRVGDARVHADKWNAVGFGEDSQDLFQFEVSEFDEDFTEESLMSLSLLQLERFIQLMFVNEPALDEYGPELLFGHNGHRGGHVAIWMELFFHRFLTSSFLLRQ